MNKSTGYVSSHSVIPVKQVILSADVLRSCQTHSLLTDSEEVIGFLIGEIQDGGCKIEVTPATLVIYASRPMMRKCKQKDRVEVDSTQMAEMIDVVEEMKKALKQSDIMTIGWYHSHPNITVFPSAVDIQTQMGLQGFSKNFVALIFSAFVKSSVGESSEYNMDVIAFQSYRDGSALKSKNIPLNIVDQNKLFQHKEMSFFNDFYDCIIRIQEILLQEEEQQINAAKQSLDHKQIDLLHIHGKRMLKFIKIIEMVTTPLNKIIDNQQEYLQYAYARVKSENQSLKRK